MMDGVCGRGVAEPCLLNQPFRFVVNATLRSFSLQRSCRTTEFEYLRHCRLMLFVSMVRRSGLETMNRCHRTSDDVLEVENVQIQSRCD